VKRSLPTDTDAAVGAALKWMERRGSRRNREGMARYGIVARHVYGISVGTLRQYAKQIGRDHALAQALWRTERYEARMLAVFVDQPDRVTPAQMDRWCRDFDNWAICDTACFHLFDKTPYAFAKVRAWATRREEFVKRAAFALLASLALHDRAAPDAAFVKCLPLIARAASDDRNFVKKGVSWALRGIGARSQPLKTAALEVARRLATSDRPSERWIGTDAIRDLSRKKR
jgi:3-methyladenine DNA glycosylase AlkD